MTATPQYTPEFDELESTIVAQAGRLSALTCAWLLLIAQFDAASGFARWGLPSTAHWLQYACGLAHRTATDHVRVARALATWPTLRHAMSAGRVSYSQARAISRIADRGDAELVADLLTVAEHGTVAQLEVTVRGLRTVADAEVHPEEYARQTWTDAAQWRLSARLDPERGAIVGAALAAIGDDEQLNAADALVRLAEIGLAALADREQPPRGLRGDERAAVVVELDAARLPLPSSREPADSLVQQVATVLNLDRARLPRRRRPAGRIVDGPGLPDQVVERLLCTGRIRTVVTESTDPARRNPLDVGRTRRVVTERQYRALALRHDRHCAHPGCRGQRRLEAHHVVHWLHGGRTDMDNLILLCPQHHHAHHDGEFRVVAHGRGRFTFHHEERAMPDHVDPGSVRPGIDPFADVVLTVDPTAATTRWSGERLDRHWVVDGLSRHLRPRAS